jgi:hypothetical protein
VGNYVFSRFVSPNASVTVSELGPDVSTTADDGKGLHNLDVNAMRINGSNALTAAGSVTGVNGSFIDMSASSVSGGLVLPTASGAAPTANGQIGFDSTTGSMVTGSNGGTAHYANSTQYGVNSNGGVALTSAYAALGTNTATGTQNTFTTMASVSLAAGTWYISAKGSVSDSSALARVAIRIRNTTDSANVDSGVAVTQGANNETALACAGTLTIAGTKTVAVQLADLSSGNGTGIANGSGITSDTSITAVRIGQ